jgi:hypothetical protein
MVYIYIYIYSYYISIIIIMYLLLLVINIYLLSWYNTVIVNVTIHVNERNKTAGSDFNKLIIAQFFYYYYTYHL